ncbi:6-bladed beta-propeller [Aliifodinibius sp. S!AR15-10]|uniref:6-bladed beta-propeller n=1 Tax=Aliifodinibius sp. S!AR15-10 TaxID=2950437 RepID=UPI00285868DF|nr:6-bladed beta-propeller [Aliifodinibius sp. S!AR15-10]MDR8393847.1 6-bladed beta-propeller [Aliifodinibius sp. S!AR15-10]
MIITWGCIPQKKKELPKEVQEVKNLTVHAADTQPTFEITLEKVISFGSSDDVLIGRLGDVAVDDSGRVFIADVQKQLINVFGPDGRFITQLGREGKGPSEFSYIKRLQVRNDHLYASDANFGIRKVGVFTLDTLAGHKTIILARNKGNYQSLNMTYPGIDRIFVRNNGTYLAEFISDSAKPTRKWQNVEIRGLLYSLDRSGKIASDKLFEFKKEIRTYHLGLSPIEPFFGNALTALSSDNSIYWAGPDYFLIKEYSPEGAYRHAFYYPHKKISLTRESAIEAGVPDLYIKNMRSMDLPESWPVLRDMKIDDRDRLWVATTVKNMKVHQWWVLKQDGQLIARFNWPRSKPIQVIKNGYLYTRETEEETGLEQIVRYRFKMD